LSEFSIQVGCDWMIECVSYYLTLPIVNGCSVNGNSMNDTIMPVWLRKFKLICIGYELEMS